MRYPGRPVCTGRAALLGCLCASSLAVAGTASGQQAKAHPIFRDGQAQVVPEFQDSTQWIRQSLWVESGFDSDGDGKPDRIHVDVTRPRQTETAGLRVPVIYEASPYYSRSADRGAFVAWRRQIASWDAQQEVDATPPQRPRAPSTEPPSWGHRVLISTSYTDWVSRGFAVVHAEAPGTGLSQGCPTIGGTNEGLASKAVIDWLNGRARAFTTRDGNTLVVASWSTGKVGMIGTSYNGTLTLAAATTGVDGLKVIVPVSPVSSWYEYYRANGLVRSPGGYLGEDADVLFDAINTGSRHAYCAAAVRDQILAAGVDRVSGDQNAFWNGRDYLAQVDKIKAAVLLAHGIDDWNTMPDQSVRVYDALKQRRVPTQLYLHQGSHGGDPPEELLNGWFTHYLYDVNNGVDTAPRAWIVREGAEDTQPTPYADYPNPAAKNVTLHLRKGGNGVGGLSVTPRAGQGEEALTDDVSLSPGALARATSDDHRLLYATPVLREAVHLSGWTSITLHLASSKPAANLSVYLVALPAAGDSAGKVKLLTRGWADPQNAKSLTHGEPLVPGQFSTLHFNLEPEDRVIPAGMRIALMLFSSDRGFTVWPHPGTRLTVVLDATTVTLPLVGGTAALDKALGQTRP